MLHIATDRQPGQAAVGLAGPARAESASRLSPLVEAQGVLRDVVAAVRNLEDLLRSPKVASRALARVIPELKGLGGQLLSSVDEILANVRRGGVLPADDAASEIAAFVGEVDARLAQALDRALGVTMDAKRRLAFEGAIARTGSELDSVRRLLDLLVRARENTETELDLAEVIEVTFGVPSHRGPRPALLGVIASYPHGSPEFRASPGVLLPLLSLGVALVPGDAATPVFLEATCRAREPVTFTMRRSPPFEGEAYSFEPPLLVPPSLTCGKTAALLSGGRLEIDGAKVALSMRPA